MSEGKQLALGAGVVPTVRINHMALDWSSRATLTIMMAGMDRSCAQGARLALEYWESHRACCSTLLTHPTNFSAFNGCFPTCVFDI